MIRSRDCPLLAVAGNEDGATGFATILLLVLVDSALLVASHNQQSIVFGYGSYMNVVMFLNAIDQTFSY